MQLFAMFRCATVTCGVQCVSAIPRSAFLYNSKVV